MFKSIIINIRKFEIEDLICVLNLALAYIPAMILRFRDRNPWCIVERIDSADDNGWHFYQWMKTKHPEQPVYFLLDKQSDKFDPEDESMVAWRSFKHYVVYLASNIHIKTIFMTPRPSSRMCSYYERYFKKNLKTVYLKHGICKDGLEHHYYSVQKVRLFICGAKPEYDYLKKYSDYPEGYLKYTGLARYDDLLEGCKDNHYILLMPTWRRYLTDNTLSNEANEERVLQSEYFKHYNSLLKNEQLLNFLENMNYKLIFCIHPEFNRYKHLFKYVNDSIRLVDNKEASIHELLMGTSLLITDYSSVFFDVAYMSKPVIFYHFDYDEFREKHFSEGYFSYARDGMGPVVKTEKELLTQMNKMYNGTSFVTAEEYVERADRFFPLKDRHNCERIYNEIKML